MRRQEAQREPSSQGLTADQRATVLHAVRRRMTRVAPALMTGEGECFGSASSVDWNLDGIVDIARRTTAERLEPYVTQVLNDVCPGCPNQLPSGRCPLREIEQCVLCRYPGAVFGAVRDVLEEIGDPQYLAGHEGDVSS